MNPFRMAFADLRESVVSLFGVAEGHGAPCSYFLAAFGEFGSLFAGDTPVALRRGHATM